MCFGQDNHCWDQGDWKWEMLVKTSGHWNTESAVLGHAYILGLQLIILGLSNQSLLPIPLLLFQAVVLYKELFSSNVHEYILCLGRMMLVDHTFKTVFYHTQTSFF